MQWIALYYLGKEVEMRQKDLAEKMHIKESTVARLVDRMEKEGFIQREKNEEDRRITNLVLTDKGRDYREKLLPEGERLNDVISKDISEEDMSTFKEVLKKMVNNVQDGQNMWKKE